MDNIPDDVMAAFLPAPSLPDQVIADVWDGVRRGDPEAATIAAAFLGVVAEMLEYGRAQKAIKKLLTTPPPFTDDGFPPP